jgi:hypothetical protein
MLHLRGNNGVIKPFCGELGIHHSLVVGHVWLSEGRKSLYCLQGNLEETDPCHDYTWSNRY